MTIDPEFMRQVQAAGWTISYMGGDKLICECQRDGCALKVALSPAKPVPETNARGPKLSEVSVASFEEARRFLRDRREALGLSMADVEDIAGLAGYHIGKMEKDGPSKIPNFETFLLWANALGYDIILRPGKLPPRALRIMAKTAEQLRLIRAKFRHHAGRRQTGL